MDLLHRKWFVFSANTRCYTFGSTMPPTILTLMCFNLSQCLSHCKKLALLNKYHPLRLCRLSPPQGDNQMSCHESKQAGKLFDCQSELNLLLQDKTHNDMNIYFDIDTGHIKLLSRGIHYDHCKTSLSTYQRKALSKLHWALPLIYCTFTACRSYVHF